MKFVVSSSLLSSRLQTLGRVIVSKNSLPILDSFLFEIVNSQLRVTASDNETTIITTLPLIECENDITFVVNAKTIQDAMKEIPDQPLEFYINNDNLDITVIYQNGKYQFMGGVADEYPSPIALPEDSQSLTLTTQQMCSGITRALFATADDALRPVMNGIYFDLNESSLTIVASDGRKLACNTLENVQMSSVGNFILQKRPAGMLKNILAKEEGDAVIRYSERNAAIETEHYVFNCRLTEGRYPNYSSVIPHDNPYCATVNREALQSALRRVQIFSSAGGSLIRIQLDNNKMTISTQNIDFSMSAEESLLCDYNERPITIGFPSGSLMDVVNNLDCEEIILRLADPSRAGIIYPAVQKEGEKILMLLMPIMLAD